jgi:carboxypeptidase C (cathepsin A)
VQSALGVPVNYSAQNVAVAEAFTGTGDFLRPNSLDDIGYLLDSGVKVALVYGDRDFACNWIGGEKVSTAVDYSMSDKFKEAGYTPILSTVGVGGQVRQYGNFSFSRVYQAGHEGK